jgi:hypothetical protein
MLFLASRALAGEEYMADVGLEPMEFRGVKWQQSLDSVKGMEELFSEDDGAEIICKRSGEEMSFGGTELESVEYIFIDRKLSMVSVVTQGAKNQDALLAEAKSLFGEETLHSGDDYIWRFTNVSVMYSKEPEERAVIFYKYIGFMNK